jgi:hypothetical protein
MEVSASGQSNRGDAFIAGGARVSFEFHNHRL